MIANGIRLGGGLFALGLTVLAFWPGTFLRVVMFGFLAMMVFMSSWFIAAWWEDTQE